MPLKGRAKKDYQREYMRRRRLGLTDNDKRSNKPTLKQAKFVKTSIQTEENPIIGVQPDTLKQEKIAVLRELIADPDALKSSPSKEESRIPLYNRRNPQIGEKVKMPSGEVVVVPELDGDGNRVYED